jgi:2-phosphosulfolactate phosphatase
MRVDVVFGTTQVTPPLVLGRVVAVIDVLRASSTIATALANGARNVVPLASADDVITRAKGFERSKVLLAGEQRMHAVPGFDVGNSPLEFTPEAVDGKTVLLTTTNGTATLLAIQGARDVVVGAYVNFSAVLALLRSAVRGGTDVTIVGAGRDRQFSLEDAACAGRFSRQITKTVPGVETNDGAFAATLIDERYGDRLDQLFADSEHGQALADAGFERDLEACAQVDACPVVPIYQDRQITRLGPDRER